MAVADRRCAQKRCQFLDGHGYRLPGLCSDQGSRFDMHRVDYQSLALPIKPGIDPSNESIAQGLRNLALTENLSEEEVRMLAQITYRGHRPDTADDWRFLYESIKRSMRLQDA